MTIDTWDVANSRLCIYQLQGAVTVASLVAGWTLGFGAAAGGGAFTRMFPSIDSSKAMWPHNLE
jgi:hypothetical protein